MAPLLVGLFKITVIFLPVIFLFFFKGSVLAGYIGGCWLYVCK